MRKLVLTKEQRKFFAEFGRIGGKTRAKNLTAAKRKAIAIKASRAAKKARKKRSSG
jgi:hypothetical protein